jgi:peptidoglycan-associated lipoprotein
MFADLSAARGLKFAATLVAALALAGCASQNQNPNATGPGAATPGSQQDFVVNVGDRIFFANDSSDLSGEARAILDRQATWLGRYPRYSILL